MTQQTISVITAEAAGRSASFLLYIAAMTG
jgi:hypothetical protein